MPRRGENIRKRTDGRWEGRYIEYYSSNGKACYRSVYGTTYTDTKEKLKKYKKLCKGTVSKITVENLCKEWLYSKKGCPFDNAPMESFHSVLKKEEVYLKHYSSFR